MNLSKYITLDEFQTSQTAIRLGIDNVMNNEQINSAEDLCQHFIDVVQDYYKKPVQVSRATAARSLTNILAVLKQAITASAMPWTLP